MLVFMLLLFCVSFGVDEIYGLTIMRINPILENKLVRFILVSFLCLPFYLSLIYHYKGDI